MSVATITFTDNEADDLTVSLVFDGDGLDESSGAHRTAVAMMRLWVENLRRNVRQDEWLSDD